jgi:hypothetical protein
VRRKLIEGMNPRSREAARLRLYSYCRRTVPRDEPDALLPEQLRLDIVLTKPYRREAVQQGGPDHESSQTP